MHKLNTLFSYRSVTSHLIYKRNLRNATHREYINTVLGSLTSPLQN